MNEFITSARILGEKLFVFILIYLFILTIAGGLIPTVSREGHFSRKDIIKLAVFTGIITYIFSLCY